MSLKCSQKFEESERNLDSWMSLIDDETLLNKIAIPGSHDACTQGVAWAAETQTYTIEQQLKTGARYFDVRVNKKGDEYVIFHSIVDGMDFLKALDQFKTFIKSHPTEVLILDFQHFKGDSQEDVLSFLKDRLGSEGLLVENKTGKSDLDFITHLKLKDARGKCLICWGDRNFRKEDCLFYRNDNECTFDDMSMDSYYIRQYHTADTKCLLEKAHPIYFERLAKLKEEGKNGLFVLQCQLSDKYFIRGPWSRERNHDPIISKYINELKDSDKLEDINIILRDFINPRKCIDIIELNRYKGYMK